MQRALPLSALAAVLVLAGCGSFPQTNPAEDGGNLIESADGSFGSGSSGGGSGGSSSGSSSGGGGSSGGGSSAGSSSSGGPADSGTADSGTTDGDGGGSSGGKDGGGGSGSSSGSGPITCPGPGSYTKNGGSCGSERWDIKTGTDPYTSSVALTPTSTTIATLTALPAAGGGTNRESPTEATLWELKDVTLSMIKGESDSDYHMVLSDGAQTMIAEIPYPDCASTSAWSCFISRARSEVDAKLTVGSPQYPALTVTVRGVGFFDHPHGQTGVAPNAIELHPVLQLCFGQGCTPT